MYYKLNIFTVYLIYLKIENGNQATNNEFSVLKQ